jgi:predicted ribonuclease YlaK
VGWPIVLDTNVYVKAPKLEELRQADLGFRENQPLRVVVPAKVLDELDNLKQQKDAHNRWRGGYTTAVIWDRLRDHPPHSAVELTPADQSLGRAEITLSYLPDPRGHDPLSLPDEEIIDRAHALSPYTSGGLTLVTYDAGMALRAQRSGLETKRLTDPVEREPEPDPSKPADLKQGNRRRKSHGPPPAAAS